MIIELSDEIEGIIENIEEPNDIMALGLNKLFELMSEHKHVIYAKRSLLEKIKNFQFINPSNKKLIDYLLNHYVDIYSSMPNVIKKVKVVLDDSTVKDLSKYHYIRLDKACYLNQAKLAAENPNDGNFYINIFMFLNTNKEYTINFENSSFAGGTAESFINEMDKCANIILAISDSDKDYENCDYGATAKHVIESVNNAKDAIMNYYILNFREKENLFPIDGYILFASSKDKTFLKCIKKYCDNIEFMKYVNIKDGIKKKQIEDKNEYWHILYDGFIKICRENNIFEGKNSVSNRKCCIKGIGGKYANRVCNIFLNPKYKRTEDEQKIIEEAGFDIKEHIPKFIIDEWENIFDYLFSYGCALKDIHNSFLL